MKRLSMRLNLRTFVACVYLIFLVSSCGGRHQLRTNIKPGASISKSEPIAVVPSRMGSEDALVLPDAISTELIGQGFNVIDRSALAQRAREKGLDLSIIINEQEYYKLGNSTNVNQIVIVTSQLFQNSLVKNATVKVINTKDGSIIFSSTFANLGPTNPMYIFNLDLMKIARLFAESIGSASH